MLHVQSSPPDWPDALKRLPTGSFNKYFSPHLCEESHTLRPDCLTTFRHHVDHQSQYFEAADLHEAARAYIGLWFNSDFLKRAHTIAGVEGLNEMYTPEMQAQPAAFDIAYAQVWTEYRNRYSECRHIRPILGNIAVGNDAPVSVAKTVVELDCYLAYHSYWVMRDGVIVPNQSDYALRWQRLDELYTSNGYFVEWLFTEAGAIGFSNPDSGYHEDDRWIQVDWALDGAAGWRHPRVLAADTDAHLDSWRWFIGEVREWNRANGNRALGANAFTCHQQDDGKWKWFLLTQPHLNQIADLIADMDGFQVEQTAPPPVDDKYQVVVEVLPRPQVSSWNEAVSHFADGREDERTMAFSHDDAEWMLKNPRARVGSHARLRGRPDQHPPGIAEWYAQRGVVARFVDGVFRPKLPRGDGIVLDVSRWQRPEAFDVSAAKEAGVIGVYVRASYGLRVDDRFEQWVDLLYPHFKLGAYHWIKRSASGLSQAQFFWDVIRPKMLHWPAALDVEKNPEIPVATPEIVQHCFERLEELAGYAPLNYTSRYMWDVMIGPGATWARRYPLWVSHFTGADRPLLPDIYDEYVLWQYKKAVTALYSIGEIDHNRLAPG